MIGVSVFLVFRDRFHSEQRRFLLISELCRFIERTRNEISCYLKPIEKIPQGFSSALLSELYFLQTAEVEGFATAFCRAEEKIPLREREKRIFEHFFENIGHGYVDDELKLIDSTLLELKDILAQEETELSKKRKLFLTLSATLSLAVIILLI